MTRLWPQDLDIVPDNSIKAPADPLQERLKDKKWKLNNVKTNTEIIGANTEFLHGTFSARMKKSINFLKPSLSTKSLISK